jgi:O-glycosyl hydrolase
MSQRVTRLCIAALCVSATIAGTRAADIILRPEIEYQTIVGFGGNDPRDQVSTLVNDLGMSAHRAWINCETSGGGNPGWSKLVEMKNAGVECFIASPWSPPANMKYVNSCIGMDATWNKLSNGLGPMNDYRHPNNDPERGGLRNFYPDFAAHLAKYAKDFKTNVGIDLYAISPQNEPAFPEPYASCVYYLDPGRQVNQFRDVVLEIGQKFEQENLGHIKLFGAEDMLSAFTTRPYIQQMMLDTGANGAAQYMDALAVHGYSNGVSPAPTTDLAARWGHPRSGAGAYARSKGLDCWMTETSGYMNWAGGDGPDGPCPGAQELGVAIFAALKYGYLSGWWWWRLAVTESYWIDEALIYNGNKQKTYHVSKMFYKYIRPGMQMIHVNDSADAELGAIAFRHKQNQLLTIVFVNSSTSAKPVTLVGQMPSNSFAMYVTDATRDWAQQSNVQGSTLTVPANSFVTLYATGYNPAVNVFDHYHEGRFTPNALGRDAVANVYAMNGSLVRTIHAPRFASEKLAWDRTDARGQPVAAGTYCAIMSDANGVIVTEQIAVNGR